MSQSQASFLLRGQAHGVCLGLTRDTRTQWVSVPAYWNGPVVVMTWLPPNQQFACCKRLQVVLSRESPAVDRTLKSNFN